MPGHAAEPQVFARVRKFSTDVEVTPQVVQFVAVELEMSAGQLERVD